ncbi:hypothetical protein TU73_10895 [Pseudomonas libanensis]|uniref:Dermonecrotic toxin N-terminal domain-containing protein n=1 Tax=Pseudomonas libanensis TaxID=75588 RepID=A0A0R2YDZ5_9PSED|nr:hypothetical protein TU73_10895 [Pseudomonas libanensis]
MTQHSLDDDLVWDATQRWQDCHRELRTLMAGIPSVRSSINQLLQEHLQLDGERVGLQFAANEQRGSSRISLTEACLYMQQHPNLDTTQLPPAAVLYLPAQHSLSLYTPSMLLDQLKILDLKQAIDNNWLRYWRTARAPDSPATCLKRAEELYRVHFEASAEHLLAEGKVNSEVLAPLFRLINPTHTTPEPQNVCCEQVLLKPAASSAIALPGAWVLTLDSEQPVRQLLYVPAFAPAWYIFTRREDLERWVLDRQTLLFATASSDPQATIEYRIKNNPLDDGISLWIKQLTEEQYQDAIRPVAGATLDDAFLARLHIDQLDARRQGLSLFAEAPPLPQVDAAQEAQLPQFGQLHNGVDAAQREALVRHQRDALERLFANDSPVGPTGTRWQAFRLKLDELKAQQRAGEAAAQAMLNRRPFDLTTLNTQYSALYQARLQGLRIEAQLQQMLGQISEDELQLIESAVATPLPDVVALAFSIKLPDHANPTVRALNGPLVFLPPQNPQTPDVRDGCHVLYWPGNDGGVQRFASRQALEEQVFSIHPEDDVLALQFITLSADPFDHSLSSQQTAFEEQAARLHQTWSAPEQATRLASELELLREQTVPTLLIPDNTAREVALVQLVEQHNARLLAEQLPSWLRTQTTEDHKTLKVLLNSYIDALGRSQALQQRSLLSRDAFVDQQIQARLRKDFALQKGFTLQLDLPDIVEQKRDIISGSAPGTPIKIIHVPSKKRSKMSLNELALRNIDSDISQRLFHMKVEATADDASELATLRAGITYDYLKSTVSDLDLAKRYETLILETFRGAGNESLHEKQYRRECLIKPLQVMLKAQSLLARMQNHISADERHILDIAIDADTRDAWRVDGKHISLLPAHLSAGGKDTNDESPITLSGITFIEEKISGTTLLYLPDTPDGRCLRGFANLNQARIALFDLCRLDSMVEYVAGRAIKGDVRAHIERIDRAIRQDYDAMIQAGLAWPATTSLAAHLLNAHMGRLIEANRNDARSNDDLAQEKYALKSGELLNGIKIALGFVPFIGTAVSLVDAGISLYQAVEAFRRGQTGHGIDQLASVFECLVFAVLDAVGIAAAPAARGSSARQLTRARQAKPWPRPSFLRSVKSRQATPARHRFAGYEHPEPLQVGSLQPVQVGPYRHTFRHTSGEHFILSEGRYFKVKFDPTAHEMRLSVTGKSYAPVIALDHALQWDTYSALHRGQLTAYSGGTGRGRGRARGAEAPTSSAVARQTPPEVTQVRTQRQHTIDQLSTQTQELAKQALETNTAIENLADQFRAPTTETGITSKHRATHALDVILTSEADRAKELYALSQTASTLPGSTLRQTAIQGQDWSAMVVGNRNAHLALNARRRMIGLREQFVTLKARMAALTPGSTEYLSVDRALKQCRVDMFNDLKKIKSALKDVDIWLKRISAPSRRSEVTNLASSLQETFTPLRVQTSQAELLSELVQGQRQAGNPGWIYQERLLRPAIDKLKRTIATHRDLPEANISHTQRNQVLNNIIETYEQFNRHLTTWSALSPDHFDPSHVSHMLEILPKLIERARRNIKKTYTNPQPQHTKTLFETEDGQTLVGAERPPQQQSPRQFIVTDRDGQPIEVWEQISDSRRYRLNIEQSQPRASSPALPSDLPTIVNEAQARLDAVDALESKVRAYNTMEPINLEHILVNEAEALEFRAHQVQSLAPDHLLIEQLRSRATLLKSAAENLRIERTLASKTPTEGYVDYLIEKNRLEVRKVGIRRELKQKRPDGKTDYLQEYALHDRQQTSDQPLWYAHFHYVEANSAFDTFAKAHVKIPEQRFQGLHWQMAAEGRGVGFADLKIWRGNIEKPFANKHFAAIE